MTAVCENSDTRSNLTVVADFYTVKCVQDSEMPNKYIVTDVELRPMCDIDGIA